MQRVLLLAGLFWALLFAVPAQAAPTFPELSGRVVDQANILSGGVTSKLSAMLAKHEQATSNQVVVVTVESLQGHDIAEYGYQFGREWGIGQKGRDNGVLFIIAPNERKVRIEVGYGLEGSLTDVLSKNIIDAVITPRFKKGDMKGGITEGTRAILAAIEGTYEPLEVKRKGYSKDEMFGAFIWLLFGSMFVGIFFGHFVGNRLVTGIITGAAAGGIGVLLISMEFGIIAGALITVIYSMIGGGGGGSGRSGYYGGGYSSGGYSSGGFSGGFSGGGGSFGGGGASGGW